MTLLSAMMFSGWWESCWMDPARRHETKMKEISSLVRVHNNTYVVAASLLYYTMPLFFNSNLQFFMF